MKTIKEWLGEIEDEDIREKAISNTNDNILETTDTSFYKALSGAFIWRNSLEGHDYWENILEEYHKEKLEESQATPE